MDERPNSRPTADAIDQGQADPNSAEQLDATALGEERGDGLPGVNTINDRGPMSSEDPALLMGGSETEDELHTREWRERPEATDRHHQIETSDTAISDAKTTK